VAASGTARAETFDNLVRIGVLNDISVTFQDTNGMSSVEAAGMAPEDFNGGRKNIKLGDLTGKACSPNTVQGVNDAWAIGKTTAAAMMQRGDTWPVFPSGAFGQDVEAGATTVIEKHGVKVLGSAKHPWSDSASLPLPAQNSKARVTGVAKAGGDAINAAAATGSEDTGDEVPEMKKFNGEEKLFSDLAIRQDGRVIHPIQREPS
jgi:hypothetical protein